MNNLTAAAVTSAEVRLENDGSPWRPLAHIEGAGPDLRNYRVDFATLDEIFLDRFVRLRGSASCFPSASSMRCSAARSAGSSRRPVPTPHMRADNASATPMLLNVTPSGGTHGS